MTRRPYYTLLHRDGEGRPWGIAFGDYSEALVKGELEYYQHDAHLRVKRKDQKIIRTESANQFDINKMIRELNAGSKP